MKTTNNGVKFDNLDEAVTSLTQAGYQVSQSNCLFQGVIPVHISKDYPMILGDYPTPVACLSNGTDLDYVNRNDPVVKEHHKMLKIYYDKLSQQK